MSEENQLEERLNTLFQQARDYVIHEDDLVDRRLKWVITITGFLFAAYGATWIAWPDEVKLNGPLQGAEYIALSLCIVRMTLAIFGYASARIGAISIQAAHHAIRAVTRKYNNFIMMNRTQILEQRLQVWQLIGDRLTHLPGFYSSAFTPFGIAVLWAITFQIDCILIYMILVGSFDETPLWLTMFLGVSIVAMIAAIVAPIVEATMAIKKLEYSGRASWLIHKAKLDNKHISKRRPLWISEQSFRKSLRRNTKGE
ncbi:hypothetical protein SAMN05444003_1022 [Cognatiyoonia sediminum]|uniref:Uncharacterized protein n=1 Tax=Cognatiyoonia sediminum TaxID=1508389 RepID=A0A1M5MTV7_9RHOB|nr:hypothetical protein [Cognatiyoonia sediminum]SHG80800.1 hypothetical protein SAMN05444003_1022 [Cognatiyoonia sediminum]